MRHPLRVALKNLINKYTHTLQMRHTMLYGKYVCIVLYKGWNEDDTVSHIYNEGWAKMREENIYGNRACGLYTQRRYIIFQWLALWSICGICATPEQPTHLVAHTFQVHRRRRLASSDTIIFIIVVIIFIRILAITTTCMACIHTHIR